MAPNRAHFDQIKYLPVVEAIMQQAGLNIARDRWEFRTTGSAHVVINMGHELSVRVAKTPETGMAVARRTEVLRRLPHDIGFEAPRPITRVITRNGYTGVGLSWIKGEPRKPGPAPSKVLASLLYDIHAINVAGYEPYLDSPHSHWGGSDWERTLREQVVPLLLKPNQKRALAVINEVQSLDEVSPTLIHGDLAGHNILWNGDKLAGVIDWDHACLADPAYDVASLANWYGWESLKNAVTSEELERAQVIIKLLPLEAVAYTLLHGMGGAILRLSIERADEWLIENKDLISYSN